MTNMRYLTVITHLRLAIPHMSYTLYNMMHALKRVTSGSLKGATYNKSTRGSAKSQRRAIWLFSRTWGLKRPCLCPSERAMEGKCTMTCRLSWI